MGGSSTFGYETKDGSICYCVYNDYVFHEQILPVFTSGKKYEFSADEMNELIHATSIDDYFSESRFEEEDSKVRAVYRLDGTVLYRYWGDKGKYVFYPNE